MDSIAVHGWRIAGREHARHEVRRGRRHAYEVIDPARTALVVVDMVRFFGEQSPFVRGILPRINEAAAALRSAGGLVAWGGASVRGALAGTVTSVCCESAARDASTLGYQVIVLADGCADVDDAAHDAALRTIYRSFGDVRPTAEVLDLVARPA